MAIIVHRSMYVFFGLLVLGVLDKETQISKTISHCSKQCITFNYSYIAKEKRKVEEQISHEYEQNKTSNYFLHKTCNNQSYNVVCLRTPSNEKENGTLSALYMLCD